MFDSADALRDCANQLNAENVDLLSDEFASHGYSLSLRPAPDVIVESTENNRWRIVDGDQDYRIRQGDDTTLVVSLATHSRKLYSPPGTYKGNFVFNGDAPVMGAGAKETILQPYDIESPCVWLYGGWCESNHGATLTDLSIVGPSDWHTSIIQSHIGLKCGSDPGSGFSNGLVERVEISALDINWDLRSAVMCSFRQVYSHHGGIGLMIDNERGVTTCHFDTCRFTTSGNGLDLRGGHVLVFTNCNSESNKNWNWSLILVSPAARQNTSITAVGLKTTADMGREGRSAWI